MPKKRLGAEQIVTKLPFAQPILLTSRLDRLPAPLGAYKFPRAMSFNTCFSSDRSATSFLSRLFSSSSRLSRFAWSTPRPPYSFRYR